MADAGGIDDPERSTQDQNGLRLHHETTEVSVAPLEEDKEDLKHGQSWTEISVEDADDDQVHQAPVSGLPTTAETLQGEDQDEIITESSHAAMQSPGY